MNNIEYDYLNTCKNILETGIQTPDRTGTGTITQFGIRMEHDMKLGLPVLTTKRVYTKGCIHELLWFISGDTNIKYLQDNNVHIWDKFADEHGGLGPVYGKQWRKCGQKQIDQLKTVIETIKTNPTSRRILMDLWTVDELDTMSLPPCVMVYQFFPNIITKEISLQVYQRSADMFLGVPFDMCEAGLLLELVGHITGYNPSKLIYIIGNAHIYNDHIEQVKQQLNNIPRQLPQLQILNNSNNIDDYKYEDFNIINYNPYPPIKANLSV